MLSAWWPTRRSWWIVVGALAVFGALLVGVLAAGKGPLGPDLALTSAVNRWALDGGSFRTWQVVTKLGESSILTPLSVFLILIAVAGRRWRVAAFVAIASCYSMVSWAVKVLVERPRPPIQHDYSLQQLQSFPSGHAGGAMAFAMIVVCVVAMSLRGVWRVVVAVVCFAIAVLVAISRLALGVHYPSDVLAGFGLAIAWVLSVALVIAAIPARPAVDPVPLTGK